MASLLKKSEYFSSLSITAQQQYERKIINTCLTVDPYAIESWTREPEVVPKLHYSDLMLYMVSTPSPHTKEAIKAWKGLLDSNGFVKASWVHDLELHQFSALGSTKFVVKGKVKHSQRMNATPLLPWVILDNDGVAAAHCTCMAGIGEACSHVATVLSCIVKAHESRQNSNSCTSQACQWLPPAKNVSPAFICDINFDSPSNERSCVPSKRVPTRKRVIEQPSLDEFMSEINMAKKKPAILKVHPQYAKELIPKTKVALITDLYNPETLQMDYMSLLSECESVFTSIKISYEQSEEVEKETRGQTSKNSWFKKNNY